MKQSFGMGAWKTKQIQKKNRGSQTSGASKGIRPSQMDKTICRRNRSYNLPQYDAWCALYNGGKVYNGKK